MLEIKNLSKTYGTGATATHAVGNVSFSIEEGEFVCVVGPSGCGKTTLLKCIAGLLRPSAGEVLLRGGRVTGPPEQMALVFQEYSRSLMPWMSVRNNVLLPLRHKKLSRAERRSLVEDALRAVGLVGFMDRYPWQLSGGMQQRVAIARALAYQPQILLMDEPFASVDAQTRGDLEDLVLQVRDEFGITILFVTHDIDESVYLSDRVVALTHAPTEVKEVIPVALPKPRDQIATKELAEFARLRAHVYRLIKREQDIEDVEIVDSEHRVAGVRDRLLDSEQDLPAHHHPRQALLACSRAVDGVDSLATPDDRDSVGDLKYLVQLVRDEDDGHALSGQSPEDFEELVCFLWSQDGGRLVEDQDVGVPVERLQDLDALLLADRDRLNEGIGIDREVEGP